MPLPRLIAEHGEDGEPPGMLVYLDEESGREFIIDENGQEIFLDEQPGQHVYLDEATGREFIMDEEGVGLP